jgi:hypothetical protein
MVIRDQTILGFILYLFEIFDKDMDSLSLFLLNFVWKQEIRNMAPISFCTYLLSFL